MKINVFQGNKYKETMKQIILIILIITSSNLFSYSEENNKSNLELGVSVGLFTGSGVSFRYSFTRDFSFKLSGLIMNSVIQEELTYEARIAVIYSIFDNNFLELYFINSGFRTNLRIGNNSDNIGNITGLASGVGLKFKIKEILPFYMKPSNNNNISLSVELQENMLKDDEQDEIDFEPNVILGFLFNF